MAKKKPIKSPVRSSKNQGISGQNKKRSTKLKRLAASFLARRPHRSFRRTRRRDYVRALTLPGYISFTIYVLRTLRQRRSTFLFAILFYGIFTSLLVGIASQDLYTQFSETLRSTSGEIFAGGWGEVGKAGLLLLSGITGNFSAEPTEAQQIYGGILILMIWLTTVWLLRAQLAGSTVRLRDGLYNSGAPIIATAIVFILFLIQLVPMALAILGYTTAVSTGLLENGAVAMVFFIVAFLLVVLSLYLVVSSFFAMVIVTLPGMYPWQALRTAGDLVVGRRLRIILRLSWMLLVIAVTWIIIMVPIIIFATWLQTSFTKTSWIPIIPGVLTLLTSATIMFVSAYIYLLYRKMVEDNAKPA